MTNQPRPTIQREFTRNLAFWGAADQEKLEKCHITIAGLGGDGGLLAEALARMGIGHFTLADPDTFSVENMNRQSCFTDEFGQNKARVVGRHIARINPSATVSVYEEGVTTYNAEELVAKADILVDATDISVPFIGQCLARAARQRNIPNFMGLAVGFGAQLTCFKGNEYHKTFEGFIGLREGDELKEGDQVPVTSWLSYIPPYMSPRQLASIAEGLLGTPAIMPGVLRSTELKINEIIRYIFTGSCIEAPDIIVADSYAVTHFVTNDKLATLANSMGDMGALALGNAQFSLRSEYIIK